MTIQTAKDQLTDMSRMLQARAQATRRVTSAEMHARIAQMYDTLHSIDPARLLNEQGTPDTAAVVNATLALSDGTALRRQSIQRLACQLAAGGWGAGLKTHQAPDELVPFQFGREEAATRGEVFDSDTPFGPAGLAAAGGKLIGDMLLDRFQLKIACPWMALRGKRPEMRDVELLIPRVSVIVTPDIREAIIAEQLDALLP